MVKKFVVEVQEVWLVSRKYYTLNDSKEDAIEAYLEGSTIEPFEDYEVLETCFSDVNNYKDGYEIIDVYED
jgi:hypothetical protein